jgi:hypothetical protein
MVVAVDAIEHLDTHAEETSGLPFGDAGLHKPGRRRAAERVRANPAFQSG